MRSDSEEVALMVGNLDVLTQEGSIGKANIKSLIIYFPNQIANN